MNAIADNTMYKLGQLSRAIWPKGDMPMVLHDVMLKLPATGLGRMIKTPAAKRAAKIPGGDYAVLLARLPADLANPPGGLKLAEQAPYWLGWYHYGAAIGQAAHCGPADLERAGKLLFGERWQSDLARALSVGDRRVREWVAGDRRPSAGVWADIAALLRQRQGESKELLADMMGDEA